MREMNAQEIVRWLNDLEGRCRRLRWIAGISILVAIAALVIPALPERISPWKRDHLQAYEFRSPDRLHTGTFALRVAEGNDPSAVLTSTNRESHASLGVEKGVPVLDLFDEAGSRVEMRLAPDRKFATSREENRAPAPGEHFYGLSMREPADAGSYRARLGGDQELLALDLASPLHGAVRLWAGRMDPVDPGGADAAEEREPGAALVLLDREGTPRVSLAMLRQPPPAPGSEEEIVRAEGPIPEMSLLDENGRARVVMRLDPVEKSKREDGSVREDDPAFAPSFVLRDHLGRSRIELTLDAAGSPRIRLRDERGNILWSAP